MDTHYEKSQMYQIEITIDLMILWAIKSFYKDGNHEDFIYKIIQKSLKNIELMSHKNGVSACFNDSCHSAHIKDIFNFIEQNKIFNTFKLDNNSIDDECKDFYIYEDKLYKLIVDTSSISPRHIPGHSHSQVHALLKFQNKDTVIL